MATERLKTRLYLAMPLQIIKQLFVSDGWLGDAVRQGGQIILVFSQSVANRLIDDIRKGAVGAGGFQTQGPVQILIEVYRGAF